LGSDVAFFLYGGTVLVKGRGEKVTPLPSLSRRWVVVMVPPVPRMPGKTQRLYASLKPKHYTKGQFTDRLVVRLSQGGEVASSMLFNVFDEVAVDNFTGLGEYREKFLKAGAGSVHLAGSGPALFTLVEDKAKAEKAYENLQKQGLECYLADTSAAIEEAELTAYNEGGVK
jgi:4-diphosphocytidyl-2-C-methyl-D-erythritol kinase